MAPSLKNEHSDTGKEAELSISASSINFVTETREFIKSTFRSDNGGIVMDEAYDYGILGNIDPDDIFPEIVDLKKQLSETITTGLTCQQEINLDNHILNFLSE